MRHYRVALIAVALVGLSDVAYGQGMLDRMKKRAEESAKRKVEDRVGQKTDKATDKVLDGAENAVKCAATDKACADKAAKEGKKVVTTDDASGASAGKVTAGGAEEAPSTRAGEGAWANYDFVPGNRLLFATDFTKDKVGDFPARLEFVNGVIEVVQWQGTPYLRVSNTGKFFAPLAEPLPDRFTIEWDYLAAAGECWVYPRRESTGAYYSSAYNGGGGVARSGGNAMTPGDESKSNKLHHARVMVDKRYTKMYIDDKRVANVPNVDIERENAVFFYCDGTEARPMMIGNIRIAAGGKALYDAISTDGRVATQGILFDTGSDVIRPESTPTLKEIATMLAEHPDLRLAIEGHTDNVGAAEANLSLSAKRAAAVKTMLVGLFGVSGDRLTTKGLGATKPAAPNTTAEGRQTNRRVELVKQ
jgi:outer membrane protein OmpA-like peptidoglycan-associated protein